MIACLPGAMTLACMGGDSFEPPASEDGAAGGDAMADAGPRAPEEPNEPPADAMGIATWSIGALGTAIGASGIAAGQPGAAMELYVGGSVVASEGTNIWSALRYSAASGRFEPVYVSDLLPTDIERVALARAGSRADIVVALSSGIVRRYDQRTWSLRTAAEDPCATRGGLLALITADLNGDGFDEIVSNSSNGMLFAYGSQYPRWQRDVSASGTFDLTAGQVDADPALEVATANGHVVDSATHALEWIP